MNRFTLALKRPFIWLYRIRHRCGYGVHSPFAFNFITYVIYERTPYYKYDFLVKAEQEQGSQHKRVGSYESRAVKRLLFRLVNYASPRLIVDAGKLSASTLYLREGKKSSDYIAASERSELFLEEGVPIDFLYLHDYQRPGFVEEVFRICAARATPKSLFVIGGICYTRQMRACWKKMQQDERVGITFDLYDLGILFFDKTKVKQDYIVNF